MDGSGADFDAEKKRLDIEIDFKTGGRFPCPECGKADCPVHDTVKKTWRHLDFFQQQAFLHARVAGIDCPNCGVRLVTVPWARPGSGFTLLFEAFAMTLVTAMPVAAAARLVGEHHCFGPEDAVSHLVHDDAIDLVAVQAPPTFYAARSRKRLVENPWHSKGLAQYT